MASKLFAVLPQDTINSTELNKLKPTARWIYVVLAGEAHGREVQFRCKYERLIKITGFSSSTIKRGIDDLAAAGFIRYDHGGLQNPNEYSMVSGWLDTKKRAIKAFDAWEGA